MTQTKEEKSARRKARREKRKEAAGALLPGEVRTSPVAAQKAYPGFEGTLIEKFTDESSENTECYRIYTLKLNVLGVLELEPKTQKWYISITRFPQDWDYSAKFDSMDKAMKVLYEHYLSLVTSDSTVQEVKPKWSGKKRHFRRS